MSIFFNQILAAINAGTVASGTVDRGTITGTTVEVTSNIAWTWFGRPNSVYSASANKYWVGTTKDIDNQTFTTQHVTEFDILSETYTDYRVGTVGQKDDHNQTQIIIRQSDNRLIAFYVEHNGSLLRWKISTNPLDASSWGAEKNYNPVSSYSYITPYQRADGVIFMFFRSRPTSQSTWYYAKSIDGGETFGTLTELYSAGATHNYLISHQDGNKIHFTASNGHPQSNSDININTYHFYFDISTETAHLSGGATITLPLDNTKLTLVNATTGSDTSWIIDIITKNGNPRVLFAFYPSGRSTSLIIKELWFAEWNGLDWVNKQKISEVLNGYIEQDGTPTELGYTGASRFDVSNPDIIWMPKEVNGVLEIHKVNMATNPITIEQITFNSTKTNWRPISVPTQKNNLLWLRNESYEGYQQYNITLLSKTVSV